MGIRWGYCKRITLCSNNKEWERRTHVSITTLLFYYFDLISVTRLSNRLRKAAVSLPLTRSSSTVRFPDLTRWSITFFAFFRLALVAPWYFEITRRSFWSFKGLLQGTCLFSWCSSNDGTSIIHHIVACHIRQVVLEDAKNLMRPVQFNRRDVRGILGPASGCNQVQEGKCSGACCVAPP